MDRFRQGPLASPPPPESFEAHETLARSHDYIRYLESMEQADFAAIAPPPAPTDPAALAHDAKMTALAAARDDTLDAAGLDTAFAQLETDGHISHRERISRDFYFAGTVGFEDIHTQKEFIDKGTTEARGIFTAPAVGAAPSAFDQEMVHFNAAREAGMMRDPKVREMVWQAMNPVGRDAAGRITPTPPMPDNYEIPPEMEPQARAFLRTQQDALRSRYISIVLGEQHNEEATDKKLFKKLRGKTGYSPTQRDNLLHDLEGTVEPHEYETLRIAMGDTSTFSTDPVTRGIQMSLHQNNLTTLRQKYAGMDNQHAPYQDAQKGFYADIAKNTYEKYLNAAIPDPANRTPENLAILKKEVGARMLVTMMRRDQDIEAMKYRQMRPYETREERGRAKKMWDWYRGQSIPVRVGVSMAVAAGTGVGIMLFPAFTVPIIGWQFAGGTAYTGAWGISAMLGTRAARAATSVMITPHIQRFIVAPTGAGIRASKEKVIQKVQIDDARNKAALNQLATGQNYIDLVAALQDTAHEANEKLARLDKSHKRWSLIAGLGTGVLVSAGIGFGTPKILNAAGAAMPGSGSTTPGKGFWPDESRHLPPSPTAPNTLPPTPSEGSPATPPDIVPPHPGPDTSAAPPAAPDIKPPVPAPEADGSLFSGLRKNFVESYNAAEDKWNNFWSTFTGGGARPRGGTTAIDHHLPPGHGKDVVTTPATGRATTPVESVVGRAVSDIETVQKGDSVWKLLGHQLHERYGSNFDNLPEAQKRYVIDAFKDKVVANPKGFGLVNPDRIQIGKKIDFSQLFKPESQSDIDTIFGNARGLTQAQMDNIMRSGPPIRPARPAVSHQPRVARPRHSTAALDNVIEKGQKELGQISLAQRAQADVLADAQRAVASQDFTQQNLGATGLDSTHWGKDFWNRDFRAKGMTLDQFAKRTEQLADEMRRYPDRVHDYGDVTGGGATQYDIEQLNKVAQQLKKAVPPGEQTTTTVEQAFQRHSLGNNPPVGRPRPAAPQVRAENAVPPPQPPAPASGQIRIRPGSES